MNRNTASLFCRGKNIFRKRPHCWLLLICILFLSWPPVSLAKGEEAGISKLILASEGKNLEAYLWVEGAFPEKIQEAINTGLPLTFSYTIILERPRRLWPAAEIAHAEITHTIHYNTLLEYYTVTRSWEKKPRTTADLDLAKAWMTHIGKFPVIQSAELEKGTTYRIRAKAKLREFRLPLYLHRILFFLSFWDFETDWYSLEFTL